MVIAVNYRALIMPIWLLAFLSLAIVAYSLASFVGYFYWMVILWNGFLEGTRVTKILYFLVLGLVNLMSFYMLLKVFSLAIKLSHV